MINISTKIKSAFAHSIRSAMKAIKSLFSIAAATRSLSFICLSTIVRRKSTRKEKQIQECSQRIVTDLLACPYANPP
jgi:hypothetical protein